MRERLTRIAAVFLVTAIAAGGFFCFSCVLSPSVAFAKTPSEPTYQSEWNGCASYNHTQILKQATCLVQSDHNTQIAAQLDSSKQQSNTQIVAASPATQFPLTWFINPSLSHFTADNNSPGPPARSLAKTIIKRE